MTRLGSGRHVLWVKMLSAGIALGAGGCPKHEAPPVSGPDAHAVSVAKVPASGARPDAGVNSEAGAVPDAAGPFAALGGACGSGSAERGVAEVCDSKGRVVGVYVPVDSVQGVPPPSAEVIRDEPRQELAPGRSLVVALEGDRLWFRLVSCGACRRVMGWSFAGELSKLSDAQLLEAQKRIGLPDDVAPLRTPQAWRDFYRDRPLPAGASDAGLNKKPSSAPPGIPGECMNRPPHEPVPPQCQNLK